MIWIFCCSGLKVLFTPPKFLFFWRGGGWPWKFRVTTFWPTKATSLRGTTRFEPSLVQIWRSLQCDHMGLAKKTKKKRKKTWQTGHLPRPPTSPDRSQSLHAVWPPVCSSIYQVLLKSVFLLWVVENRPSVALAMGLYNSLYYRV